MVSVIVHGKYKVLNGSPTSTAGSKRSQRFEQQYVNGGTSVKRETTFTLGSLTVRL